ncbi:MAG: hypothetical protein WEB06_09020 [Actinomycetota bacterium]
MDSPAEHQAGEQAQEADASKSRFQGWVAGIYVAQFPDPKEVQLFPCEREDVEALGRPKDEDELRTSPFWFDPPSYLPPGTFDWTYPGGDACGSEPAFGIWREFLVDGGAEITIGRSWRRYFRGDFSEDRVQSGSINGLPAVIIPPFTAEGYGDSHIIVRDPSGGTIQVNGFQLPLSELQKIAEALVRDLT